MRLPKVVFFSQISHEIAVPIQNFCDVDHSRRKKSNKNVLNQKDKCESKRNIGWFIRRDKDQYMHMHACEYKMMQLCAIEGLVNDQRWCIAHAATSAIIACLDMIFLGPSLMTHA